MLHTEVNRMNRRRELTLQRLSRIGGLAAVEEAVQAEKPAAVSKGKPMGTPTIEAVLGTYMSGKKGVYDLRTQQDDYVSTAKNPGLRKQQQLSRQMAEYMAAIEESQLANARTGVYYDKSAGEPDKERQEKTQQALKTDKSAKYQMKRYAKKQEEELSVYDKLDANRCSGFLLYSYNKNGVHSVLGENISPGSYGGRITSGSFISKA